MAKVEIVESLFEEIEKKCKQESTKIFDLMQQLETHPYKGKEVGCVGGIVIKELKYGGFRFYFITDGFKLKCLSEDALVDLLLRFVRLSEKKRQQETISEIKNILKTIGPKGFK